MPVIGQWMTLKQWGAYGNRTPSSRDAARKVRMTA